MNTLCYQDPLKYSKVILLEYSLHKQWCNNVLENEQKDVIGKG